MNRIEMTSSFWRNQVFTGFLMLGVLLLSHQLLSAQKPPSQPNILFAIADDASYPHMGAYGSDWIQTPAFDRVAEQGLLFTRAYVPNPKCAPSRSIILTGRNSWQLEEAANHWPSFPQKFKVYTEALAEAGYFVGSTGKGWAPGIAVNKDGAPRHLAGTPFNRHQMEPATSGMSSTDYAENFRTFLKERPDDAPFSFWYGGFEPHRGYEWKSGLEKGGKALEEIGEVPAFFQDNDTIRTDLLDYAFEIEHFDRQLGLMLSMLEEQGELRNTLVVVTADNGMPFPRIKGQTYEYSAHMPLAIMWPAGIVRPGRVIDDVVSFADFAPTFIELAGRSWKETGMSPAVGQSLTDIFYSERGGQVTAERDYVLLGKERHDVGRPYDWGYPVRGIIRGDFLYLRNFKPERWPAGNPETGYLNTDGSPTKTYILDHRTRRGEYHYWSWNFGKRPGEELYNITDDPYCLNNLAGDPGYRQKKRELKEDLYTKLKQQNDPRMIGRGYVFDSYPYMNDANSNFYHRYRNGELTKSDAGWVNASDFEETPLPVQRQ
ncbi:sulfatase family protein [Fodinibius sediminis]|uniref:Arylsulfatase A n=1 Tax=Fodinibius sediminis TaxID=1214077 RepID=A0A521BZU1_9BACT|nr:sulfatase [Fodinibius sediminis]SMO52673.1 Arylsulfatase A [Fodinibius sediminis]